MKIIELSDQLPKNVIQFYMDSGITEVYPPQADAIQCGLLDGKNIVAAIPTASGKTLLAELAMLKSVLNGGKAVYIVPLRALASEKYDRFSQFASLGIEVGISTGDFDSKDEWLGKYDIIVATSEKVDSLLRNEASWTRDITVIVADEVHLINSPNRGPTLEITLAKLMKLNPSAQVLALSATIGNANELAKWLDAELIQSEWRPVELREGVLLGKAIKFMDKGRALDATENTSAKCFLAPHFKEVRYEKTVKDSLRNKDDTIALSTDTIKGGGQCLIFTNTRKNSESIARRVGKAIQGLIDLDNADKLTELAGEIRETGETGLCEKLAACIENGTAFHHAGLRSEHRRTVENGYRSNAIKVIACTPTLASGLNLPARRVVIRDYKRYDANFGLTPIPVLEIKQMCGRAGRPGLDPYGESILIAKSLDEFDMLMENYVLANPEDIWSKLGVETALRTHLLSTIATGFAQSREQLFDFIESTFYACQQERWSLEHVVDAVLEFLEKEGMIIRSGDDIHATELGGLVSKLYIDPASASIIIKGLKSVDDVVPFTLLHLICQTPDVRKLYLRSNDGSWVDESVERHHDEFICVPDPHKKEYEWFLAEAKTAMLFYDWIYEENENDIIKKFGIGPGDIRALCELAEWLMHSTAELSALMGLRFTRDARDLVERIKYGIGPELLKLIKIKDVGRVRARRLYNAGYTDIAKLRDADPKAIMQLVGTGIGIKIMGRLGVYVEAVEGKKGQANLLEF